MKNAKKQRPGKELPLALSMAILRFSLASIRGDRHFGP
jgi:hypothetical protein